MGDGRQGGGKPQVKKAVFETTKKKEIGVSDLTLLSKISNEAINDNLKLRFEHDEIYVRIICTLAQRRRMANSMTDLYRTCVGICQPV